MKLFDKLCDRLACIVFQHHWVDGKCIRCYKKNDCTHAVVSFVFQGNTFWRCRRCHMSLKGSGDEFPGKCPAEIMNDFVKALPPAKHGGSK